MSEDNPAELEDAEPTVADEAEDAGTEAEAAAAAAAAEPDMPTEWVSPVELHLPSEVAEALQTVMNALLDFGRTVQPVLDASHSKTAEDAAAADPLYMPEGVSRIANIIGDWSSQLDGMIVPFTDYIARIDREASPITDYRTALEAAFAPPAPTESDEDESGDAPADEAEES